MRPGTELFVILALGATLLAASFPFYASLARTPEELFFGDGVFVISQASAREPLSEELAEELGDEPWVTTVSPEVYALVGLQGRAVVVRGVQLEPFAAIEGLPWGPPLGPEFAILGARLAAGLGLEVGDTLLLPGSTNPLLMEVTIDRVHPASGPVADEILLDLPRARLLTGMGGTSLTLLRVHTGDGDKLLAYLASSDREVLVAGEGQNRLVEGGAVLDDRIGSLVLTDPTIGRELGRSYLGAFAQHSANSLSLLILGMEGLTLTLLFVMLGSSLTRFWLERRGEVGLLRALGGGGAATLRIFATRLLGLGLLATGAGLALGIGIGVVLEAVGAYSFFGHVLPYAVDAGSFLLLGGLYLTAFVGLLLLGLAFLLRQRPRDLLHEAPEPGPDVGEDDEV